MPVNPMIAHFTPKHERDVAKNLDDFVYICRHHLTVFGSDLNWDALEWPGAARFTKLGAARKRDRLEENRFDDRLIEFAKAYLRYQQGMKPTGARNETKALRAIESIMAIRPEMAGIVDLNISVLDEAAGEARSHYTPMAAYHAGREIQRLAMFVSQKKLTKANLAGWMSPIRKPDDVSIQVGVAARERQSKALPSEVALNALAEIFSNNPPDPRDTFTSSAWAMLLSAPSRVSEVLLLPVDLEVEETDRAGNARYGWRFFSGKGFQGDIKWIPDVMVGVARESVRRIRELTEMGRGLARWIEHHPEEFYRHANCPNVPADQPLSAEQVARALGLASLSNKELDTAFGACTLAGLWKRCMSALPDGFPWLCQERRLKYSEALFCMRANELHHQRGVSPLRLWAPDVNTLNNDLCPRESLNNRYHQSIFDRHGYLSEDGTRLKVTTHQARHLLNTIANRGGLSNELIAKWSGRADMKQNRVYNHMNEFELVAKTRAINPSLSCFGPEGSVPANAPVVPEDLALVERGSFHWTEYGMCSHDYTMSPCERFRDCIGCPEQVCIKGDEARERRIRTALTEVERDLEAAKQAVVEGFAGSDRWVESHLRRGAVLRDLIRLLDDPAIPEHTQIRLSSGGGYSHLGRAIVNARSVLSDKKAKKILAIASEGSDQHSNG